MPALGHREENTCERRAERDTFRRLRGKRRTSLALLVVIAACASNPATNAPPPSGAPSPTSRAGDPAVAQSSAALPSPLPSAAPTDAPRAARAPSSDEVYAKVKSELVGCYEIGRKAIPNMTSGKVTFHAAVDGRGTTTCVIPSDDTGLTQEVEDCMRRRLEREEHASSGAAWSVAVPIVVRDASVSLGKLSEAPTIESIESHGLAEDMYGVIEGLLPEMKSCLRSIDKASGLRVVYVGARVGKDGKVECVLASSSTPIPNGPRECVATTLSRARFSAPKRGYGLLSIPLALHAAH